MIRAFVKSVEYMSPRKIGALVAIQRVRTYKNTLRQGIPLMPIFQLNSLLISLSPTLPYTWCCDYQRKSNSVTSAYLPLTESTGISKEFGTRHQGAIGLSEVSGALTFIVSEETGRHFYYL